MTSAAHYLLLHYILFYGIIHIIFHKKEAKEDFLFTELLYYVIIFSFSASFLDVTAHICRKREICIKNKYTYIYIHNFYMLFSTIHHPVYMSWATL